MSREECKYLYITEERMTEDSNQDTAGLFAFRFPRKTVK